MADNETRTLQPWRVASDGMASASHLAVRTKPCAGGPPPPSLARRTLQETHPQYEPQGVWGVGVAGDRLHRAMPRPAESARRT
jgi:hypothetical protein